MLVWLSLLWALLPATMKAQTSSVLTMPREVSLQTVTYEPADSMFIEQLLADTTCNSPLDFARRFIGRPYVAATLEVNDREQLVVNTRQLDCTTLVETATVLALCHHRGLATFADYASVLTEVRYRDGRLTDYASRLHYFSDWIRNKETMHLVSEVQQPKPPFTAEGKVSVSYMTTHPQAYRALREHPELLPLIAQQEKNLTGLRFHYIPKAEVKNTAALRKAVADGDIIAITCNKPGLDIAHVGIAAWHQDGLHLLNASQLHKKVVEEPMTLGQYLSKHPSHTGIRVIRLEK
jgi:hypothetical protein